MSKSKYNVINPDLVVAKYGADVFRMYEMFLGPIEASKPWDTNGIDGVSKFLKKYASLFYNDSDDVSISEDSANKDELKILHKTIKRVQEDIERFSFNTCISSFMIAVNELKKLNCNKRSILDPFNRLMASFAPFTCEEINSILGNTSSVHLLDFPDLDESFLKEDEILYPISINGKKRGEATFPSDAAKDDIEAMAKTHEVVIKWSEGKSIKRIIVVPGRMINVVVA
jgi:leucyl-tRNA synthetase